MSFSLLAVGIFAILRLVLFLNYFLSEPNCYIAVPSCTKTVPDLLVLTLNNPKPVRYEVVSIKLKLKLIPIR